MKERPILFSVPMVRALLAGIKTQTRRICKLDVRASMPEPEWQSLLRCCPYGQPGDRLWVRETCRAHELTDDEASSDTFGVMERLGLEVPPYGLDGVIYEADGAFQEIENTREAADRWADLRQYGGRSGAKVPAIHMPRWASRITLEITAVRVERLQDISETDAQAEGAKECDPVSGREVLLAMPSQRGSFVMHYRHIWDEINGPGSWAANPWVWVVEMERAA